MSKFDYCNFEGGYDLEFVVSAKKYTKEDAVKLCILENDWRFKEKYGDTPLCREPKIEDVKKVL